MKKISMFAMENDTDRYAICIDGFFGLFESPEEANRVWAMIGGHDDNGPDGDSLAETPFGSAQMLPPGYVPVFITGAAPDGKLSDYQEIDIEAYIKSTWDKFNQPVVEQVSDSDKKTLMDLFNEEPTWRE